MKLEELARQSADAARVSVAHLDPPSVAESDPRRPWLPILAGAAVVVLIVAGLYVLVRDRTGSTPLDPADTVLPAVAEVPRPVPEPALVAVAGKDDGANARPLRVGERDDWKAPQRAPPQRRVVVDHARNLDRRRFQRRGGAPRVRAGAVQRDRRATLGRAAVQCRGHRRAA